MKIPLFKIYTDNNDIKAVNSVIKSGMNWAAGPNIEKFENLISNYVGKKYTVVFNSGTSALYSLLLAYEIRRGNEVIVPSFSFIATANAVLATGAKPIFADIEPETYGLDIGSVEKKITPKTKAILPMHYGGVVAKDIKNLNKLAKKYNLLLIEDAAESFGAKLDGEKVGTFGDAAMFSFCQTKVFTTGEGGCVVTDSKEIYEKLKLIRAHGRVETSGYFTTGEYMDYITLGYNFRMADMIAALGISQIKKVDKLIEKRRQMAQYLTSSFLSKKIKDVIVPQFPANIFHVFQEYHIRIKSGEKIRDLLKKYLYEKGIDTRISFKPIHLTQFYKKIMGYSDSLENTEKISKETLTLPLYPILTKKQADYIVNQVKIFYQIIWKRKQ